MKAIRRLQTPPQHDAANSPDLLALVERVLDDGKAEDIVVIDLTGESSIADSMVIATGRSQRQVIAMAERLRQELHAAGVGRVAIEGLPHGDWVLLDAGDVIVHLFRPEVRAFYNLEKMWGSALPDPAVAGASARDAVTSSRLYPV